MRLTVSEGERAAGALTATSLSSVLRGLNDRGFAILENAVPLEAIEPVHGAYMDSCALGKPLKNPPLSMPFVDHRLIANPLVVQIMRAAMGDKIAWGLYYIHAVPPRSGHEAPPHRDGNPLFPELPFALPISGLSVDIPLDDFTEDNGATRLWPGTHALVDIPPSDIRHLEERSRPMSSVRMTMSVGSLCLRDMRLWHGSMPNGTDETRAMISLGYTRVFPHAHERLPLPTKHKKHWPQETRSVLKTGFAN
jgi:ectoine hydroxylase-related dioxygenase (phytanoyl-CoA dioxygenase family)